MVVLQVRAQLQETIIARRRQHKCAGDWQPPFMVVLKVGDHSCRMTYAKFWKGKCECFGIIFQPEVFGIMVATSSGGTEMSLKFGRARVISLSVLVSSACAYGRANSTVRVITLSTQNCAQAGSQSTRPLPHMNLNVSERLICALLGLSRSTDRVTG